MWFLYIIFNYNTKGGLLCISSVKDNLTFEVKETKVDKKNIVIPEAQKNRSDASTEQDSN